MVNYRNAFNAKVTPQSEPIPGMQMVKNNAGGFVFALDKWAALDRFLILGTEGGTYYASERKHTKQAGENVLACIKDDGVRVVNRVVEISHAGRAPKNDPALFVLALCASAKDQKTKDAAFEALPKVARIATHLFHFVEYVEGFRGWGRALKRAVANWYLEKDHDKLALQLVKYKQRDGWSHRDLLRLSHPVGKNETQKAMFDYVCRPETYGNGEKEVPENFPKIIITAHGLTDSSTTGEIIDAIRTYNLPREVIPTKALNDPDVWRALLVDMPLTAMIRNLGKMTAIDVLKPFSKEANDVAASLVNEMLLHKSRVHPMQILEALRVYSQGHGDKGSLTWTAVPHIVDALDAAFYLAFKNVVPCNKRILLGVDVSGSMGGATIAGSGLTAREASAAMALITAAAEPAGNTLIFGFAHEFVPLNITPRMRLDDAVQVISRLAFGATDCALPMLYALQQKLDVDAFCVYTDNETWAGQIHPTQALQMYRAKHNIPAKLVVCGMTATNFSIADPKDAGMMDVVGFDSATPALIADFVR